MAFEEAKCVVFICVCAAVLASFLRLKESRASKRRAASTTGAGNRRLRYITHEGTTCHAGQENNTSTTKRRRVINHSLSSGRRTSFKAQCDN